MDSQGFKAHTVAPFGGQLMPRLALFALAWLLACVPASLAQTPGQPAAPPAAENRTVVVPAPQIGTPAPKKADPRTIQQQRRDQRAFERCLLRAHAAESESPGYNPWVADATEVCRRKTGMENAAAAPTGRR
jgi:hypothetical protein